MVRVRLILPVPPSWNRSYRAGQGRFYTPDTIVAFRTAVLAAGRKAGVRKIAREVPVRVTAWWYRGRRAGDLDKRISVMLDALAGVTYCDDAQVAELHCFRLEDAKRPRLEVEVEPLVDGTGIAPWAGVRLRRCAGGCHYLRRLGSPTRCPPSQPRSRPLSPATSPRR
jgi:Holliday junction resolvase RusA-like endonuclease